MEPPKGFGGVVGASRRLTTHWTLLEILPSAMQPNTMPSGMLFWIAAARGINSWGRTPSRRGAAVDGSGT